MAQEEEFLGEEFTEILASLDSLLTELHTETPNNQHEHELLIQTTINGIRHQTAEVYKDIQGLYAWLHPNDAGELHPGMPPGYPTKLISVTNTTGYDDIIDKAHATIAIFKDRNALNTDERIRWRTGKIIKLATVSLTFVWALPGG